MKIKKNLQLIDQHDKNGFWGKFGGNFIPETLKKPVEDLTILFEKLRKDKKFIKERDYYFKNWVGAPTPFIKLENLTEHLGGPQIYAKVVSEANGGAHKIYNATVHCLIAKRAGKKYIVGDLDTVIKELKINYLISLKFEKHKTLIIKKLKKELF